MYYARLRLYDALEAMDGKEYNIEKFEEIYANTNSTIEEINNAADILNNANTITSNYNFPEWNDYPILFESSPDKKWNANSDRIECSGLESGTSTLTATVVTNNDATLCYELNGGENLKFIVDGKEKKSFYSKQLNHQRRYFFELTPGKHIIQWTAEESNSTIY